MTLFKYKFNEYKYVESIVLRSHAIIKMQNSAFISTIFKRTDPLLTESIINNISTFDFIPIHNVIFKPSLNPVHRYSRAPNASTSSHPDGALHRSIERYTHRIAIAAAEKNQSKSPRRWIREIVHFAHSFIVCRGRRRRRVCVVPVRASSCRHRCCRGRTPYTLTYPTPSRAPTKSLIECYAQICLTFMRFTCA